MSQALTRSVLRRAEMLRNVSARQMSSSSSHAHDVEETIKWRNVTAVAIVGCFALGVYNFAGAAHHAKHERPAYPYLHIRNKEFPWGPCGLFEWDCKSAADAK
ncbi:unnamed protein product [Closterium sp. NIES-53]